MGKYSYSRDNWIISKEELKQLVDNTSLKQMKVLVIIMYYTGARFTEVLNLKTTNFIRGEDGNVTIIIKNAKRQDNSIRQLRIPEDIYLWSIVTEYLDDRELRIKVKMAPTDIFDHTFLSDKKAIYNYFYYRFKKLCKKLDNPMSFHAFRKSRATSIANKGHSANQLSGWLGHKNLNMASWYIQNSSALTKDITDSMKEDDE